LFAQQQSHKTAPQSCRRRNWLHSAQRAHER